MTLNELAEEARAIIARAEADGLVIDDSNVIDLLADNSYAELADLRAALRVAGLAGRFPRASALARPMRPLGAIVCSCDECHPELHQE